MSAWSTDVVEKDKLGQVVEELRSLIEVGGVILVAFNEKPVRLANSEARIEVSATPPMRKVGSSPPTDMIQAVMKSSSSCREFRRRQLSGGRE
jgi:hypothetical protein